MKHKKKGRKFGRETDIRQAFLRSLVSNLIIKEKIKTTEARAKEIKPITEKLLTKAKKGDLHSRKLVIAKIGQRPAKKLFEKIAPKYKERSGGYMRIIKLPQRLGDASKMAIIEFV